MVSRFLGPRGYGHGATLISLSSTLFLPCGAGELATPAVFVSFFSPPGRSSLRLAWLLASLGTHCCGELWKVVWPTFVQFPTQLCIGKHNATTRGGVHVHSGCRPHWAALRGKLRLPHPKPLTSSTLQTCTLGKWCVLLTTVTGLALVEQHRPRREADRIGHQNDELLRHEPTHVAHRQPEAVPEEPEEQRVDVLQVSLSQISDRTTLV